MSETIEALLDSVDWQPVDPPAIRFSGIPYPTMQGVLRIGGHELTCYTLNDGRRIIDAEGMAAFLDSGVARREGAR